jgi:Response regulator containing CheY-like receiver, AAA-type ATPase, and DNA-binding domains
MKIFLSSTYQDLISHREAAARAIERLGQQVIRMEAFGARPTESTVASLDEVAQADALLGIYAHRYGYVPQGQSKSITELESDHALGLGKKAFNFLVDEDYPWPPKQIEMDPGRSHLQAFLQRLRETTVVDFFATPEDLALKVTASLGRFLLYSKVKEDLESIPAREAVSSEVGRSQVARRASRLEEIIPGARVLLVNDVPGEMKQVINILKSLKLDVVVETSSESGLRAMSEQRPDVVISDMQRGAVEDEGIRFLEAMRQQGVSVPLIFTVGRYNPARGTPPFAFGITNRVDELLNLVFDVLERKRG